jgi:ABC-type sugar transport system permease subunit
MYVGLAVGIAISVPLHGAFGDSIPAAQDHLQFMPARFVAIVANTVGTLAVFAVAIVTIRRRPLGNTLILAGVAVAALGTALSGLGAAKTAIFVVIAALLLYGGFTVSPRRGAN